MIEITKQFKFDAGHRVYTQRLNEELAGTSHCACRHLHGHEYKVEVTLTANDLDETGMITDFKHLTWFKGYLDLLFDHSFIFGISDPIVDDFIEWVLGPFTFSALYWNGSQVVVKHGLNTTSYASFAKEKEVVRLLLPDQDLTEQEKVLKEIADGITLVPFVPTAENLASFFSNLVQDTFNQIFVKNDERLVRVNKLTVWETSKAKATWIKDDF